MTGERFSILYVRSGDPVPDSGRARHRVGALFREPVFDGQIELLANHLGLNLGVSMPGDGKLPSYWHQFIRECRTPDFLDTVTVVYRHLFWHVGEETANWWRDAVRRIFAEENLAYEIDDVGGVHPRVDREFQRNLTSAVAGLQPDRFQLVRELIESANNNLSADPPNYKQAWRATLSAVEALFGLMFPYARLTGDEIANRLQPLVSRVYEGDEPAQRAALAMLCALQEWVEASRHYRHQPGAREAAQPPPDVAILSISHGASLLRWLAGLDENHIRVA
jgi:hypothetical protein